MPMADTTARLASALADRYRVERELGAGGMATVYLAEDLKHSRKVAIKVLREDLAASVGAARFLREIAIAAQLQHPNILALLDSGEANGLLYYVMPYVEGPSLRDRLTKSGEFPVAEAIRLLVEVTDGLAYAHERGVIHRDIKPDNVMLSGRHALITDFGVARAVSAAGSGHTVTSLGVALGTPAYMAPEQATADPNVDHRADIYSLGVLAYELLTGRPPFTAVTPQQVLAKQVTEAPDPVSRHRPALSPELEALVMRCLAKRPADRWQSAAELLGALEPLATPSGGTAPTSVRITATRRRSPVLLIGGALGVALVTALAWWRIGSAGASGNDRSIAVLPFEVLAGDSSESSFIRGVHGEIVTQLSRVASLSVASRASSSAYRGSNKSAREIANELGVATLLTGSVQRAGGRVRLQVSLDDAARGRQIWAETFDRELTAENLFVIQGEVAEQVANALRVQLSAGEAAEISKPATRNLAALDLYHAALQRWEERFRPSDSIVVRSLERAVILDSTFVRAWSLLALTRSWQMRLGVSFDTLPAWQAVQRTQALAPGSLESMLAAGYYHYYALGDFPRALAEFETARRQLPGSSEILNAVGLLLRRVGRMDEALATFKRATEIDRRSVDSWTNYGETLWYLGRFPEALAAYDRVLEFAPTNLNVLGRKFQTLLSGFGDTTAAFAYGDTARRLADASGASAFDLNVALIRKDWAGMERAALANVANRSTFQIDGLQHHVAAAVARRMAGDRSGARAFADSAVKQASAAIETASQRSIDPFGPRAIALMQRAIARAAAGDSALAVVEAERAIKAFNRTVDPVDGRYMHSYLALVYTLVGRKADAIEQLDLAMQVPVVLTRHDLRLDPLMESLRGDPRFERLATGGRP